MLLAEVLVIAFLAGTPDAAPEAPAEAPPAEAPEAESESATAPDGPTAPAPVPVPTPGRLGDPVLKAAPVPSHAAPATPPSPASPATPAMHFGQPGGFQAQLTGSARGSFLGLQSIPTDRYMTAVSPTPLESRIRLQPQLRYGGLALIAEADLVSGAVSGIPREQDGLRLGATPHPSVRMADLRQLYLEYKGETYVVRAGQQASNWGLGLVANGGGQDAQPGEFGDARHGDLTWRAAVAGRPLYSLGGAFRGIEPVLAADMIVRDDTANFYEGDRAVQGVFALRFNQDAERNFGVYTVYRRQRAANPSDPDERSTDALVFDVAGRWLWRSEATSTELRLGAEAALITGRTTISRSDVAPEYALRQVGAVAKGAVRKGAWEGYLDLGFASGDQNPYDARLESFRFDPDYQAGLVLFREVLGWQTARTYAHATDPDITGLPPEGVELYPTRGAVFNAAYAFPRVRHGFREWLDVYGGPLVAVTTSDMGDPFTTRIEGGTPRNALGGRPGRYLGTELDLGVQARTRPAAGMVAAATLEVGYLFPGAAFQDASGNPMPPVAAGRLRLSMSF